MDQCHDCQGRANAPELILRGLEGAQLSGAERTPAALVHGAERRRQLGAKIA